MPFEKAWIPFLISTLLLLQPSRGIDFLPYTDSQFSPARALDFWYYSVVAYCNPSNIRSWKVSTVAKIFPNVKEINVFTSSSLENQAYTAYDTDNDLIILAVRGSSNIPNWCENLDAFKTPYSKCAGCEIHAGFNIAYSSIKDSILPSIVNLHSNHPNSKIAVMGHSLGAAIATLAFLDIKELVPVDYFYSYGSPRVGNSNFAQFFNINSNNVFKARITHYKDPVPHLPSRYINFGFWHVDREVYFNEDSSSYTICQSGEDPNCSLQFNILQPVIPDHLNYMGFSQSDFKVGCQ